MAEPGNSYRGVHSRLRAVRGDPAEHPCWNPACERPAREWGLFAPPTHREEVQGDTLAWSVNLSDYVPMCHPCNLRMGRGDWATCPRGHDRLTAGVRPNGQCRECHRIVNRNYMRRKRIELKGPT